MSRAALLILLVAGLSGCFQHHTIDEGDFAPALDPASPGEGDDAGVDILDDAGSGVEPDAGPPPPPTTGGLDCQNPKDLPTQLICGFLGGNGGTGGTGGTGGGTGNPLIDLLLGGLTGGSGGKCNSTNLINNVICLLFSGGGAGATGQSSGGLDLGALLGGGKGTGAAGGTAAGATPPTGGGFDLAALLEQFAAGQQGASNGQGGRGN